MRVLALAVLALLAAAMPAHAHGSINAGELEVLFVADESSDVISNGLGYDVTQVFIGEAYLPGLGDGLYVHTVLAGAPSDNPGVGGPLEARFRFTFGDVQVERVLSTSDGTTFAHDFDDLEIEAGDNQAEVRRAFLLYPDGVGVGDALTGLVLETFTGGDLRDVAPGGFYLPNTAAVGAGLLAVPSMDSQQVVARHVLRGPAGYVEAKLATAPDGSVVVTAVNPLKQGDQHVLIELPEDMAGWTVVGDLDGGEVKAGMNRTFTLAMTPGTEPLEFNLVTDIGGRVGLRAESVGDNLVLASDDGQLVTVAGAEEDVVPGPAALLALAALAIASALRRRD